MRAITTDTERVQSVALGISGARGRTPAPGWAVAPLHGCGLPGRRCNAVGQMVQHTRLGLSGDLLGRDRGQRPPRYQSESDSRAVDKSQIARPMILMIIS